VQSGFYSKTSSGLFLSQDRQSIGGRIRAS
jgi:hypothetical protein